MSAYLFTQADHTPAIDAAAEALGALIAEGATPAELAEAQAYWEQLVEREYYEAEIRHYEALAEAQEVRYPLRLNQSASWSPGLVRSRFLLPDSISRKE